MLGQLFAGEPCRRVIHDWGEAAISVHAELALPPVAAGMSCDFYFVSQQSREGCQATGARRTITNFSAAETQN
jgi:hypothetical protein